MHRTNNKALVQLFNTCTERNKSKWSIWPNNYCTSPGGYPCTRPDCLLSCPEWSTAAETSHYSHFLQCLRNHKCDSDDPHKAFLTQNITLQNKKETSKAKLLRTAFKTTPTFQAVSTQTQKRFLQKNQWSVAVSSHRWLVLTSLKHTLGISKQ